jgi:hypothetical protein
MRETGPIHDLVHRLKAAVSDARAEPVSGATARLVAQMSLAAFRQPFAFETRGTLAEGAALTIEVSANPGAPDARSVVPRSIELEV